MLHFFLTHVATIGGFLLAAVVIAHMLRQRHSSAATAAWLLVIVIVPYVGVPLYLIFGGRKLQRVAGAKEKIQLPHNADHAPPVAAMDTFLRTYGLPAARTGNTFTLCPTGERAYQELVNLIEHAEERLCITTFVLGSDAVGEDIMARLARKAQNGVSVKVLLDGVGSLATRKKTIEPVRRAGGQVKFFMPMVHSPIKGRTNLRNHRKMAIADGKVVMAGGTNIASEYIGPQPSPTRWRDISFILSGPAVQDYNEIFRSDWKFASGEVLSDLQTEFPPAAEYDGTTEAQVVPSGPDVAGDPLYAALLSLIFSARQRIQIVTPYFVPDESLTQALCIAAHRGIDLQILVPQRSNHRLADIARTTYLRDVQHAGGRILLYPEGMVHAKVCIQDSAVAIIGSANFDMRSLFLNYEAALFVYGADEIAAIEDWVADLARAGQEGVREVGAVQDVCQGVVRMMPPLL